MHRNKFLLPAILCLGLIPPWSAGRTFAQEATHASVLPQHSSLQEIFPNLRRFQIQAPSTPKYNCVSHTLGIHDRWLWPGSTIKDFDRLFAQADYTRQRLRLRLPGVRVERIVVYGKTDADGRLEITHAARQLADGAWTSKLGAGPLIRHATLQALSGGAYGRPVAIYYRYTLLSPL